MTVMPVQTTVPAQPNVFQGAANALNTAQGAATAATQYQPQSLATANLGAYQNPFEQQVVNNALGDIERQRQMAVNNLGFAAGRGGAFGGSRHGVAESLTNEAALRQAGQIGGQLRSQGFNQAQQMAQQDIANQMGAQNLGLDAAGALGNLANLGFGMGTQIQQQQAQQGAQQQGLMQALIDAARGQFQGFTGSPGQSLQLPLQALGAVPYGQTQTQTRRPGLFNYLSLGLGAL